MAAILADLPERYSVSVPPVTNNIYRSAAPAQNYLPERRSAAFRHHYSPGTVVLAKRCAISSPARFMTKTILLPTSLKAWNCVGVALESLKEQSQVK